MVFPLPETLPGSGEKVRSKGEERHKNNVQILD